MANISVKGVGYFDKLVVDLATASTEVSAGPCILRGVYVNTTLSAHDCPLEESTVSIFNIPASTPEGSWLPMGDVRMKNLTVDPDDSATGSITVVFEPL